jgi:histidinol-phosphatase
MAWQRELDLARAVAAQAGEIALRYYGAGVRAESKPDDSPVTVADRECERLIARLLTDAFPEDGLLGEEGASRESISGRRWIIDPIDGTRDFVRGIPTWAVLVGLEAGGDVVAGVAHLPAMEETFWASRGQGAFRNGTKIRVSGIQSPGQAVVCMDCFNRISGLPLAGLLAPWLSQFWAVRSMGGIADAMMVASGRAEAWIEPVSEAWDVASIKVIVEEAGGRFLNFDGGSSIYAGNCIVCVSALEQELLRFTGAVT